MPEYADLTMHAWQDYDFDVVAAEPRLGSSERLTVRIDAANTPNVAAKKIFDSGVRRVRVADGEAVDPAHPDGLWWLALVGPLSVRGIIVDWNLHFDRTADLTRLTHLPPPREPDSGDADWPELARWTKSWTQFRLTERQGPGFLFVHDRRRSPGIRLLLDTEETTVARHFAIPRQFSASDQRTRELLEQNLLATAGDVAVWIPVPMPRWPLIATEDKRDLLEDAAVRA